MNNVFWSLQTDTCIWVKTVLFYINVPGCWQPISCFYENLLTYIYREHAVFLYSRIKTIYFLFNSLITHKHTTSLQELRRPVQSRWIQRLIMWVIRSNKLFKQPKYKERQVSQKFWKLEHNQIKYLTSVK